MKWHVRQTCGCEWESWWACFVGRWRLYTTPQTPPCAKLLPCCREKIGFVSVFSCSVPAQSNSEGYQNSSSPQASRCVPVCFAVSCLYVNKIAVYWKIFPLLVTIVLYNLRQRELVLNCFLGVLPKQIQIQSETFLSDTQSFSSSFSPPDESFDFLVLILYQA